jgi:hypothetical protein
MVALEILLWSIVGALATWRVLSLLYDEPGPWYVCEWLRKKIGIVHVDHEPVGYPGWLQPVECFWCLALVGVIPWGIYMAFRIGLLAGVASWLTTSTIIIIIERWIGRSKSRLF